MTREADSMFEAAKEGDIDSIRVLLTQGFSIDMPIWGASVDKADVDGRTPLCVASKEGYLDLVKELLAQGASIDKADKNGKSSLYVASKEGYLDLVKELLAQGASIDKADK
ncbi:unnamed protein product, partial [Aphanomyces euteiches]